MTPLGSPLIGRVCEYKAAHLGQSLQHGSRGEKKKAARILPSTYRPIGCQSQTVPRAMDEEQRRKKRERDLAYYHRTKHLIARRRRVARQERSDKQQRRVRNKTEYAREKHRRDSKKFYYKHREVILQRQSLPKPLCSHSRQAERIQTETGSQEMLLHLLAEVCRQVRDGTSNGSCNDASTSADVGASSISPSTLPCTQSSEKRTS